VFGHDREVGHVQGVTVGIDPAEQAIGRGEPQVVDQCSAARATSSRAWARTRRSSALIGSGARAPMRGS
jgi:hypothetical protein